MLEQGDLFMNNQPRFGSHSARTDIDIDFRVCGLPHAIVRQAENFRVRELVKKIESHPSSTSSSSQFETKQRLQPIL